MSCCGDIVAEKLLFFVFLGPQIERCNRSHASGHGHNDVMETGSPMRSEMPLSASADSTKGLHNEQKWSNKSSSSSKLAGQWSAGAGGRTGLSAFSWSNPNVMLLVRGKSAMSSPRLSGAMDNADVYEANDTPEFPGPFPALSQSKRTLSPAPCFQFFAAACRFRICNPFQNTGVGL